MLFLIRRVPALALTPARSITRPTPQGPCCRLRHGPSDLPGGARRAPKSKLIGPSAGLLRAFRSDGTAPTDRPGSTTAPLSFLSETRDHRESNSSSIPRRARIFGRGQCASATVREAHFSADSPPQRQARKKFNAARLITRRQHRRAVGDRLAAVPCQASGLHEWGRSRIGPVSRLSPFAIPPAPRGSMRSAVIRSVMHPVWTLGGEG